MGNKTTFFIGFVLVSAIGGAISNRLYERAVKVEMKKENKDA